MLHAHAQVRPSALPLLPLLVLALLLPYAAVPPAPWPQPPRREGASRAQPAPAALGAGARMAQGRFRHTATLLPDGRVLVVGGVTSPGFAGAEIFDALSNSWRSVPPLAQARQKHTATLLLDGRVLIAGGYGTGDVPITSAELFDPATSSWSSTGALANARAGHTATLLPDGRVIVVGGAGGAAGDSIASAEIYNPATGGWSPLPTLAQARQSHTATLLTDGRVLVVGGKDGSSLLTSAEIYTPATGGWGAGPPLAAARTDHTATLLPDGRVLVVGGRESTSPSAGSVAASELYTPSTNSWSGAAPLANRRHLHTATLLADGQVLVAGGDTVGKVSVEIVERYNPATGAWAAVGALVEERYENTATLLANGSVLIAGGFSSGFTATSSSELFDPGTSGVSAGGVLSTARELHTATLLADGRVLIAGGNNGAGALASAERYDPATNSWSSAGAMANARESHTATLLTDGRVLVIGGKSGGAALASAELYDPVSNSWSSAGLLADARFSHTATLLTSGRVLVLGGEGTGGAVLSSAALYNPLSNSWSNARPLIYARRYHAATLLADGRVLITGGYGFGSVAGAELYDPATDTLLLVESMGMARDTHTATLLPDGRVLVVGGKAFGNAPTEGVELYDPTARSWRSANSMDSERATHTATLLADGRVVVIGGATASARLATAERYDPASDAWFAAGTLSAPRGNHTATLLRDGRVLIAGGRTGPVFGAAPLVAAAELYDPRPPGFRSVTIGALASQPPEPLPRAVYRVSADATLSAAGRQLVLSGAGFRDTAFNAFPLLRLQSVGTGLIQYVAADRRQVWSDTSFSSAPLPADFPPGYALASVVVGGVSSAARVMYVNSPPRIAPVGDQRHPMRQTGDDAPLTLAVTVGDAETPLAELRVSARADDDSLVPAVEVLPGATPDTRTLRITTPPFAWGQTRVTVRVGDSLDVSERSFGLEVPREAPTWLVLLYLAGDDIPSALTASTDEGAAPGTPVRGVRADSLTTHLDRLIERLADTKQLPFNQDMRLVVLYDGAGAGDSKIYVRDGDALAGGDSGLVDITCLRRPDGSCALNRPWETYPTDRELDTGSAATLGNFLDWARRQYAGSRYTMLSIVDHGGGWSPDGGSTDQPRAGKTWQLGAWRGLNLDYSSNSALSTKELSRALAGRAPFDVLFVDACLMAMAEVAHELGVTPSSVAGRPIADYLVAGENLLWARLPYEQYLGPGALDAATTPRMLAERIVQRYNLVDPGTPDTPDPLVPGRRSVNASVEPFAIAALDLREAVALTPAIERLAQGLLADLPPEPDDPGDPAALAAYQAALRAIPVTGAITRAHRLAQQFDYDLSLSLGPNDGYVDLADFADQLAAQPAVAAPLRQLAQQISAAIKGRVVVQSRYRSAQIVLPTGVRTWDFARAYGLAIYAPIGEQDCRITGPLLDAAPTPAQLSRGAFRCALPRPEQQYVAVPGPLGAVSQYLLVERQLGYYRNPAQLAFSADAPSWAALMSRLDWLAAPRDPDPYDPSGRPYNPVSQPELGLIATRDLADGGCLLISELDFALEQCLPPASVPPFARLTHTDLLTSSVAFRPGDTPLYAWRLGVTGEGGTRVPAPATPGTITFTFTEQLLAEPDIAFERLQVLGWDGARWHTLPATAFDPAARSLTVPLQRFNRYALVSRIAGAGLDNLAAEAADLVTSPPLPQAGQPVSLALTLHRASGKDPLEDVRVRFEYQLAGGPRRVIGEQVAPLLSPRSEADTLPLVWEPPAAGLVTLFATIDPGLEIADDDKGDNVISRTLTVRPPSVDPVAPRVAAFDIAGGAPQTTQPLVALRLGAEDPAPSSGIAAMRVIEYRYSAASGRWEYAQDSGWRPYEPAFAWMLRGDPGVKYLHAWVRDGAGNLSPYPYRALISLLAPGSSLAAGGAHVYRFTLRAGECLAAALATGDEAGLVVWGQGQGGARLIAASAGALVARAGALGTYQLEVHGAVAGRYDLAVQLVAAGAPGCDGQAATTRPAGAGVAPPAAPRVPITSVPDESPPGAGWQGPRRLPLVWR